MSTYRYRTWVGDTRTIEADLVTFEPEHVAFWQLPPAGRRMLIRAVDNDNVKDLQEVDE